MDTAPTLAAPTRRAPSAPAPDGSLILDRYRLVRRLGTGGFGAVWLARDERLGREVAVKAVPRSDRHDGRAGREATAAARLNHPGIVTLYEAGADDDGHYLVSELVHGRTLAELEHTGALSDRDVVRVGLALADALAHAHARGVIHRDVKPQNVIVPDRPESPAGVAKLTDFGVALLAGDEPLTRTGDVVGTLAYMAPEQAEGRRVTAAADVYALALVLYEALGGRHPVRAAGPAATARRLGAVLPSLGRLRRDLPAPLVSAIDRALRPRPEERGTLAELRDALAETGDEVSDEGGSLNAPALDRRLPRGAARLAAGAGAGALAGLACTLADPLPVAAGAVAAGVGLGVAVLPRLAWAVASLSLVAWLAAPPVGEPGTALVVGAAVFACPLLLPRAGRLWPVPALAPLLGLAGLATAFCAVAGQARTVPRRAALGALGYWWLALAEPLFERRLLLGPAEPTLALNQWQGSASEAARHALGPLLESGLLLVAVVWALAAAVLPWVVRGQRTLADAVAAGAWAVGLAAATSAVAGLAEPAVAATPRGGLAGPAAAAVAAVLLRRLRGPDPPRLRSAEDPGPSGSHAPAVP